VSDKPSLTVVQIPTNTLMDIPANLHKLATRLERGEHPPVSKVYVIVEEVGTERLAVYGFGEVGKSAEMVGTLQLAIQHLGYHALRGGLGR
jgi:hypothetical protein